MKKTSITFAVVLIMFSLCSCSQSQNEHTEKREAVEQPVEQTEEVNPYKVVDGFIEKYNELSDYDISDASEINITDKDSDHYRVEFRLSAFKDAPAKTGSIGDGTIDIINYGSLKCDGLRIYADVSSFDVMQQIFKDAAMAFEQSITEDDLHYVLSMMNTSGGSYTIGNLTGTYEMRHDVYSFMLDDSLYIKHLEG